MSAGIDKKTQNDILDIFSLTPLQEGILFHFLQEPGSEAYCEQLCLQLNGELDEKRLSDAWSRVTAENQTLRAVFRWQGVKQPLQLVLKEKRTSWRFCDLAEMGEQRDNVLRQEREVGFDLTKEAIRVLLLRLETDTYELVLTFHHILLDGWSTGILLNRLLEVYNSLAGGEAVRESNSPLFKDFVKFCRDQNERGETGFWEEYLRDYEYPGPLPMKRTAAEGKKRGDRFRLSIEADLWRLAQEEIVSRKTTLAALLYCGWGLLLHYYLGIDDVTFGTTVSGRNVPVAGIEEMVGLCINSIPCRVTAFEGQTLDEVLQRVTSALRERESFENTPLVEIADCASWGQATQLFDHLLVLENYPLDRRLLEGEGKLRVGAYEMFEVTHYDLTVGIELRDTLEMEFEYNAEVLEPDVVERMAWHFVNVISQILHRPGLPVGKLAILSADEKRRIFQRFNQPLVAEYNETIPGLVCRQAQKTPDAMALVFQHRMVTFSALEAAAEAVALRLEKLGLREGDIVGGLMERSEVMVVAMLAAMKAGAAVMPLAPHTPSQRLARMVSDSGCRIVMTNGRDNLQPDIPGFSGSFAPIDLPVEIEDGAGEHTRGSGLATAGSLAFVFFTSGTTGVPKGILVEHRSVVNVLDWYARTFDVVPGRRVFCLSDYTFDPSVEDIFGALAAGATSVQAPRQLLFDPEGFFTFMERLDIYLLNGVPSLLRELLPLDRRPRSLTVIISGGEAIDEGLKDRLTAQGYTLFNNYGPTEITVDACSARLSAGPVTLGGPIDNVFCFILNRRLQVLPPGVPGELCVGGAGLSRGYLNDPQATHRSFAPVPWDTGKVLYRTGDRAQWLGNGHILFMGRLDRQLKIRGLRVDPEEIEQVLMKMPGIREAVVHYSEIPGAAATLSAFCVTDDSEALDNLKGGLKDILPDYMVPAVLIPVERIPRTANGKTDTGALVSLLREKKVAVDEPVLETSLQKKVAMVWQEILQRDHIGGKENFFDAGGNSLLVIRLSSRLKKEFGIDVPVTVIFQHSTIQALAEYLEERLQGGTGNGEKAPSTARLEVASRESAVPIAIVGMAGRFPGASNIRRFWKNLSEGIESINRFSHRELLEMGIDEQLFSSPNFVPAKGTLADYEYFDEEFFGFSSREAEVMDPQLRVLCEVTWEVLEDAACDPSTYDGAIGLYAGTLSNFVWMRQIYRTVSDHADFMALESLNDRDFMCSRISYALDLKGPAVTVQTACSTSLVAVSTACNALVTGQCRMAITGGVSITLEDEGGYLYQEGMVRSPDGRCKAFDAEADGTVGGNGAGLVALKCLDLAEEDGDHIYAIIKGWAVNNDGARKVGYTAPSISGQIEVIRAAQERAGTPPWSIGFVEAHGTGTPLGDPVEFEALRQVFGDTGEHRCLLGAVKTNIGHLDAAAGIAGLIKTALCLYHRKIPPTLHFETPNPKLSLENSPFSIETRLRDWQAGESPLRAGVSSFGIGGTNAHVVLEEYRKPGTEVVSRPYYLPVFSAAAPEGLGLQKERLLDFLAEGESLDLGDVAYTLQTGRKAFGHRMWCQAQNIGHLRQILERKDGVDIRSGIIPDESPHVFFMFPGQGAQYPGMGRDLYKNEPVFRRELDRCFAILKPLMGVDLKLALFTESQEKGVKDNDLESTDMAQPLIVAFEYALACCLMEWGIRPDAMIGHSVGEYTAALLSGVFSLEDALTLAVERGRIIRSLPEGAMLTVALREDEVDAFLDEDRGLALAAVNGETSVVVSGPRRAVDDLAAELQRKGIPASKLHTSHAFHSSMMEPGMSPFRDVLRRMELKEPLIPFVLNVNAEWASADNVAGADYWVGHMRNTVRFSDGLRRMMDMGTAVFIEVGPGNTLSTLARRHGSRREGHQVVNLLRHPKEFHHDYRLLLEKLGEIWCAGVEVDWEAFNRGIGCRRIPLPTYPFERNYFWKHGAGIHRSMDSGGQKRQGMFYTPLWKPLELPGENQLPEVGDESWLIFVDDAGLGQRLADWLRSRGARPVMIDSGTDYMQCSPHKYVINPRQSEDFRRLWSQLKNDGKLPAQVVYLWNCFSRERLVSEAPAGQIMFSSGFEGLLFLAQALGEFGGSGLTKISLVTNRLLSVDGGESFRPERSLATGLCRVMQQEYQEVLCRHIDVDENVEAIDIEDLVLAVTSYLSPEEDGGGELGMLEFALKDRRLFGREYRLLTLPPDKGVKPAQPVMKSGMAVIVTGGLGGIGLEIATYLGKTFRARLILADAAPFPPAGEWDEWLLNHDADDPVSGKIVRLRDIISFGGSVRTERVDIADESQVETLLADVRRTYGSIDGAVHAAGIPDAGIIQQKTVPQALAVLEAKVRGSRNLARILGQSPSGGKPGFLILFSSFSTVVGAFGQAAYVAANTFLDEFAGYAGQRHGLTVMSLDWDRWKGVGMAARSLRDLSGSLDILPMESEGIEPKEGIRAFGALLRHLDSLNRQGISRVVVTPHNLEDWGREAHSSGAEGLLDQIEIDPGESPSSRKKRPRVSVAYTPPSSSLEHRLVDLWKDFLGLETVGIHDNFFELGASSLDLIQFNARLNRALKREVGLVQLYAHPTVASLAEFLYGNGDEADSKAPMDETSGAQKPDARSMLVTAARKLRKD
jgi:amino acid adenylation domain-containing protein